MYFAALCVSFFLTIALCDSSTFIERYLPGHVWVTVFNIDWMGCLQACKNEPKCISYNYFKENKTCEINSNGIKEQCENKWTVYSRGWIYHQIRPTPEPTPELGDHPSTAAESCEKILTTRRNVSSGTYYIRVTSGKINSVYCKMEKTVECGEGGWTLAMKIDGHKATFRYDSPLWEPTASLNESWGKDLSKTETKLDVFRSITLNEGFCVGMQVNGETKWLKISWPNKGQTPTAVFSESLFTKVSIDPSKWNSLLNGSYIQSQGTKQGYNVENVESGCGNGPRARIGIISKQQDCNQTVVSRIGFGMDGSAGGMDTNNTCGNEAVNAHGVKTSIKAFCYIFVK